MSDTVTSEPEVDPSTDPTQNKELPYPCERCGEKRARYVVTDLETNDNSLFCETDLIINFAEVANQVFGQMQ